MYWRLENKYHKIPLIYNVLQNELIFLVIVQIQNLQEKSDLTQLNYLQ
jgi:hypothetical protein